MKPKALTQYLARTMQANIDDQPVRPILIRGPPGIGKTSITNAVGASFGLTPEDGLEYLDAIVRDNTDIGGLPYGKDGVMTWLPPDWSARAQKRSHGILFVDDIGAAAPAVQAACFRLILEGKSGAASLPKGWMRVAATNGAEDKTVHWKMPSPLINRFHVVTLEPDGAEWKEWALQNSVDPRVIAYLTFRGFTTGKTGVFCQTPQYDTPYATPRSWHYLSDYLRVFVDPDPEVVNGTIGTGPGTEFVTYLQLYQDLYSADDVLSGKKRFPKDWPKEPDRAYAVISGLASKYLTNPSKYVDGIVDALLTIPVPEFAVTLATDCVKGVPSKLGEDPLSRHPKYMDTFYKKFKPLIFA